MRACPPFEELNHTADLRLRVRGTDLRELFSHAAQGMFQLMRSEPVGEAKRVSHEVHLDAPDAEVLLVDWLNELLYLCERGQEVYVTFQMHRLETTYLNATIHGWTHYIRHKIIKAATFFDLHVISSDIGYEATITFDT